MPKNRMIRRQRGKRNPASLGGANSQGLPLTRLPTLDGVLGLTHTFRWVGTLTAGSYTLTAADINLLLGAVVDATHILPLIGSWRIRRVRYYEMDGAGGVPGLRIGSQVRWSDSSGSLTEETKASIMTPVTAGTAGPAAGTLVPPKDTLLSFWHRDTASGNVLDIAVPATMSFALDLTLEFTLVNQEATASTVVTAANTASGINQREVCSALLIPVGAMAYAP